MISAEKSTDSLKEIPLCAKKLFFLLLHFKFFVFDFREFYYNISGRGLFRVESLELPISFISLDVQICPQIGKFSGVISSNKLFAPFSFYLLFFYPLIHTWLILLTFIIHVSFIHCFYFILLLFFDSDCISNDLPFYPLILSSAFSRLLLKLSIEVFISVTVFLNSSIAVF